MELRQDGPIRNRSAAFPFLGAPSTKARQSPPIPAGNAASLPVPDGCTSSVSQTELAPGRTTIPAILPATTPALVTSVTAWPKRTGSPVALAAMRPASMPPYIPFEVLFITLT